MTVEQRSDPPFRKIVWELTHDVAFVPAGGSAHLADGRRVDGPAFITGPPSIAVDASECPMGCGRTTEDPYGGPCAACWAAT